MRSRYLLVLPYALHLLQQQQLRLQQRGSQAAVLEPRPLLLRPHLQQQQQQK
jgi:hypothetical protein